MKLIWAMIPLVMSLLFPIFNADARCPGGHPECGPPDVHLYLRDMSGNPVMEAKPYEQYTMSANLRNYLWKPSPCEKITVDAMDIGNFNSTVPVESCKAPHGWVLDERINDHPPSPVLVLLQVKDQNDITQYLSWIEAEVLPNDEKTFEFSWMPTEAGNYVAQIFVWKSFEEQIALKPPITMAITVT